MLEYLEEKVRDETSLVTGTGGNIHEDRQWFVFVVPAVCYTMNNRWMWLCSARLFSSSFFVVLFIYLFIFILFFSTNTQKQHFYSCCLISFYSVLVFLLLQYHDLFITLITHRIKLHFFLCCIFSTGVVHLPVVIVVTFHYFSLFRCRKKHSKKRDRKSRQSER